MRVQDIMRPRVVTIGVDATVAEAVATMLKRRVSGLPVVNFSGRLVGIVTEGDFLQRPELGTERRHSRWLRFLLSPGRLADEYSRSHGRRVAEVMTRDVATVSEWTPLDEVVALMTRRHIKHVPVVLNRGPIGMITRTDVLRALAKRLPPASTGGYRSDQQIRADIRSTFDHTDCIPSALIDISVQNGVVALHGTITDERERGAVHVAVENVPGVRAIHDHLTWVDPLSAMVFLSPSDGQASSPGRELRG